jgi:hypothetical protein
MSLKNTYLATRNARATAKITAKKYEEANVLLSAISVCTFWYLAKICEG